MEMSLWQTSHSAGAEAGAGAFPWFFPRSWGVCLYFLGGKIWTSLFLWFCLQDIDIDAVFCIGMFCLTYLLTSTPFKLNLSPLSHYGLMNFDVCSIYILHLPT